MKRWWTLVLALCVAAAAVPGTGFPRAGAEDINSDTTVDILDVQSIIVAVVGKDASKESLDINNDGRVDVLDLQMVVARATFDPASPTEENGPAPAKPSATLPMPVQVQALAPILKPIALQPEQRETESRFCWARLEHFVPLTTQTERYLFTLTPNAPPSFA